jgi:hypothetical protein
LITGQFRGREERQVRPAVLIAIKAQALALLALTQELGVIVRASGRSSKHRTVLWATLRFQITPLHGLLDARLCGHDIVFPACPSAYRPDPTPAFGGADCTVRQKHSKNNQAA